MPLVERADSVLVVVDAQPGFVDQPSMSEAEHAAAERALACAAWLVALAGSIGVSIVVIEERPHRAGPTDPQITDRLPAGTPVVAKETFSLVRCAEAVETIGATARRTAVLVGFETDTCVAQSGVELADLGYRVVVAQDGTYSTGEIAHARGLRRLEAHGAEIHDCKGLVFEWIPIVADALAAVRDLGERIGPPPFRL